MVFWLFLFVCVCVFMIFFSVTENRFVSHTVYPGYSFPSLYSFQGLGHSDYLQRILIFRNVYNCELKCKISVIKINSSLTFLEVFKMIKSMFELKLNMNLGMFESLLSLTCWLCWKRGHLNSSLDTELCLCWNDSRMWLFELFEGILITRIW